MTINSEMSKVEANKILDRVKHGLPTSEVQIIEALIVTGDIGVNERVRGSGMDGQIPPEGEGSWREQRTFLVGQSSLRHSAFAR